MTVAEWLLGGRHMSARTSTPDDWRCYPSCDCQARGGLSPARVDSIADPADHFLDADLQSTL